MNQAAAASRPGLLPRLSLMMFLQYAVWGAWLTVAARFMLADAETGGLGFSITQVGLLLGLAGSIGALTSPFAGQFADRHFRADRVLAVLMIVGGALKWYTATRSDYASWLVLSILYSVIYMPTLAMSNSIAFAHLDDRERQFPTVRVWGTIGWIAAAWTFPMIWLQRDLDLGWMPPFLTGPEVEGVTGRLIDSLKFSGAISFLYGAYCLTLPATPPRTGSVEPLAFAKAFRLVRLPSVMLLVIVGLVISTIHQVYFIQGPPYLSSIGLLDSQIGPAQTVGQFSEILVMVVLGVMLRKLGFRLVIAAGALAYALRYAVWGMVDLPVPVLVGSQFLHGFCYACFFVSTYIYVDRVATEDVRHSAQTVIGLIMLGGGPVLGGILADVLQHLVAGDEAMTLAAFRPFWWTLAAAASLCTLAVFVLFREQPPGAVDDVARHGT